jgi:hypothetical protein
MLYVNERLNHDELMLITYRSIHLNEENYEEKTRKFFFKRPGILKSYSSNSLFKISSLFNVRRLSIKDI